MQAFMDLPEIRYLKGIKTKDMKGGVSPLFAVSLPPSYLLCSICFQYPRKPVHPRQCEHLMCTSCMKQYKLDNFQSINVKCPSCTVQFDPYDPSDISYVLAEPFARRSYAEVKATCPYGCHNYYTIIGLKDHQINNCPNRPVLCPYGCGKIVKWSQLGERHIPFCPKAYDRCNYCTLPKQRNTGGHICLQQAIQSIKSM